MNWNDKSMTGVSSSCFKAMTQDHTISRLETEQALHQLLGKYFIIDRVSFSCFKAMTQDHTISRLETEQALHQILGKCFIMDRASLSGLE
jgi:hypothetical protein